MALRVPSRVPWSLEATPFAKKVDAARLRGHPLLDLTVSNPVRAGLAPDPAAIVAALADPAGLAYDPTPVGLPAAVDAVRGYYADHGADLEASRVLLTASTSEAYTWLFKVLCEPGERCRNHKRRFGQSRLTDPLLSDLPGASPWPTSYRRMGP